jgi:hypothetical protein
MGRHDNNSCQTASVSDFLSYQGPNLFSLDDKIITFKFYKKKLVFIANPLPTLTNNRI